MRTAKLVLALGAVVLAGACSPERPSYESLGELRAAVDGIGIACDDVEPGADATLVESSGTCLGSGLTLYTFRDKDDLEAWARVAAALDSVGIGSNWAVSGDSGDVERVADDLGARLATD
jgi:hypothetical protein